MIEVAFGHCWFGILAGRCPFSSDTFFDSGICHWIYIGDTALHLASTGHRVECVRLLLDAGAEVNAVRSRRGRQSFALRRRRVH